MHLLHALEVRQDLWEGTCVSRVRSCSWLCALRDSFFYSSDFMGRGFNTKRFKDLQVVDILSVCTLEDNVLRQTLARALLFK